MAAFIAMVTALSVGLVGTLLFGGQANAARGADTASRTAVAHNAAGKLKSRIAGSTADGRQVAGSFTPLRFKKMNGKEYVKGVVDGVIKNADGSSETFTTLRTFKVKSMNGKKLSSLGKTSGLSAAASCDILNLVLGPLDLDLLGLQVHLDKVVLNIVAATGAGNLLGNLLCAVAGLLDGSSPLSGLLGQLSSLLNQILAALNLGL
jgi:hypothetical protein